MPSTSSESLNKAELVPSPLLTLLKLLLFLSLLYYDVPDLTPDLGPPAWEMGILGNGAPDAGWVAARETKNATRPPGGGCAPHWRERPRRSLENASPSKQGCQKAIHNSLPNGAAGGSLRRALGAHSAPGTLLTAPHTSPHCIFAGLPGAILPLPRLIEGGPEVQRMG